MNTYLIMLNPGHNRVYYDQAGNLALAELTIASQRFEGRCTNIEAVSIADVSYVAFTLPEQISSNDLQIVSRLSFIFAAFELRKVNKQDSLMPIVLPKTTFVNEKISNLLKYSGKTNELFTRMMINIGVLSSDFNYSDRISLLDPVAGKGTTLFEAAVYGFDAAGIEIDKKLVHEACVFFKRYLEEEKYKHKIIKTKNPGKRGIAGHDSQQFEYAPSKQAFKDETSRRVLKFVRGDTIHANKYFKKNSFHLIVGDLPYGITHGSRSRNKQPSPSRNPAELLGACLPEWRELLRTGGVLVLSWNTFLLSREEMLQVLTDNGYEPFTKEAYNDFEHRVDMSIKRDLLVARKSSSFTRKK